MLKKIILEVRKFALPLSCKQTNKPRNLQHFEISFSRNKAPQILYFSTNSFVSSLSFVLQRLQIFFGLAKEKRNKQKTFLPMEEKLETKRWTDYLKSLGLGTHSLQVKAIGEIDSIKSIGYRLNSQGYEKQYQFHGNYQKLILVIEVTKR